MGTENESPEPDYQKQFQAAVRVIQNLPKNGSYRPSYEEMLRFYSYYKQATMGPCLVPRPGFWDPIGRYKCRLERAGPEWRCWGCPRASLPPQRTSTPKSRVPAT